MRSRPVEMVSNENQPPLNEVSQQSNRAEELRKCMNNIFILIINIYRHTS